MIIVAQGDATNLPFPDESTLAYSAGVIDSDGCIVVRKSSFAPMIQVGQVRPEAIQLLSTTFGGHHWTQHSPSHANLKPQFKWAVSHRAAAITAELLLPHLRIKRRQAEIVIRVAAINRLYHEDRKSLPQYLKERERLYEECRALNWTGKGGPGRW